MTCGMCAQAPDGSGETPIDVAMRYGNVSAARLLTDALHFPHLNGDKRPNAAPMHIPASRRRLQQLRHMH